MFSLNLSTIFFCYFCLLSPSFSISSICHHFDLWAPHSLWFHSLWCPQQLLLLLLLRLYHCVCVCVHVIRWLMCWSFLERKKTCPRRKKSESRKNIKTKTKKRRRKKTMPDCLCHITVFIDINCAILAVDVNLIEIYDHIFLEKWYVVVAFCLIIAMIVLLVQFLPSARTKM